MKCRQGAEWGFEMVHFPAKTRYRWQNLKLHRKYTEGKRGVLVLMERFCDECVRVLPVGEAVSWGRNDVCVRGLVGLCYQSLGLTAAVLWATRLYNGVMVDSNRRIVLNSMSHNVQCSALISHCRHVDISKSYAFHCTLTP
jgi:hypothetical protein